MFPSSVLFHYPIPMILDLIVGTVEPVYYEYPGTTHKCPGYQGCPNFPGHFI